MKRITILCISLSLMIQQDILAQGCVAIRSTGTSCSLLKPGGDSANWQFNANYRYFRSFRHFKGHEEQKERLEQHTEVINYTNTLDLSLMRLINRRWSVLLNIPIISNVRSSLYEHGLVNGTYVVRERRNTESFGLGDIRLSGYYWVFDPAKAHRGNIQVGLGIKFATGDYNYKDYWHNVGPNGENELRTVDQSIQLGDGGTGFTAEVNGYYNFSHRFGVYGNVYYLFNPREVNGTRTYRETLTPALWNETICSVPDQYMARAGASYMVNRWSFMAGGRIEGIPVYDAIGSSNGFRRPGYVVSAEPGINFMANKVNLALTVPVALYRNRTQSVTDKERSAISGTHQQGDAAFADYSINLGMSVRF